MEAKTIIRTDRVLLVIYLAAVFFLCFATISSPDDMPRAFIGIPMDKLAHFLMFLPMPLLCCFAVRTDKLEGNMFTVLLSAFMLTLLLGGLIEIFQGFTATRSRDFMDFVADSVGAAAGSAAALIITKCYFKRTGNALRK